MKGMVRAVWLVGVLLAAMVAQPVAAQTPGAARIAASYTISDYGLGAVQNSALPGSLANDRGFLLGGIGSDLWHSPGDPPNVFWMISDRGPNGQPKIDGMDRRTFPVPDFTPLILQAQIVGDRVDIIQVLPIVGQSGKAVTGLSNLPARDEKPYDFSGRGELAFNVNGLDTEGLARTKAGDFWLCEEYGPSILHVDANGKVIKRYVPEGVTYTGTDYPTVSTLPAIYGKRKVNRGFEGLTISGDEKTLYIALQSPLFNPDAATGNASRNTRILTWDIATERATGEYAYQFDEAKAFGGEKNTPSEMKVSSLVFVNPTTLIVNERTDLLAKMYLVDLSKATNLLGTKWSDPATTPTFESLTDPARDGITPLPKTLLVDTGTLPNIPTKIEGVAIVDRNTIAIMNDNDFDINDANFDDRGNLIPPGAKTRLIVITLPQPLALG